jgi:hypothetical protein
VNKGVVSPLANLVDPGMLSSESPTHADDASLLVRSRASDDAMADHEHPGLDRARDRGLRATKSRTASVRARAATRVETFRTRNASRCSTRSLL